MKNTIRKSAFRSVYTANRCIDSLRRAIADQLAYAENLIRSRDQALEQESYAQAQLARVNRLMRDDQQTIANLRGAVDQLHSQLRDIETDAESLRTQCDVHKSNAEQLEQWWNDEKRRNDSLRSLIAQTNEQLDHMREAKHAAEQIIKDQRAEIQKLRDTIVTQATKLEV